MAAGLDIDLHQQDRPLQKSLTNKLNRPVSFPRRLPLSFYLHPGVPAIATVGLYCAGEVIQVQEG